MVALRRLLGDGDRIRLTGSLLSPRTKEHPVEAEEGAKKCPVCGQGDLVDITYRDDPEVTPETDEPIQTAETRQVETYSCGHEVSGPRLDETAAGAEALDAEHRESDETTEPL
jgi:hypothetical protein